MPMLTCAWRGRASLIDIMRLPELRTIAASGDDDPHRRRRAPGRAAGMARSCRASPLLAAALPWVGHAQTRSRGTVCGSVAHADPSAELPLVCSRSAARSICARGGGARRVAASDFFAGMMATERGDRRADRGGASFPKRPADPATRSARSARRHGDFAIVACAAVVDAIGVAPRGRRRRRPAGGARLSRCLDDNALDDALDAFAWELDARDDVHATARYRRELVRRMGAPTIEEAAQMPRLSAGRRHRVQLHAQRPSRRGPRPSRACC